MPARNTRILSPGLSAPVAGWGDTIPILAIAGLVTAVPVFAHVLGQPYGLALCVLLSGLVANYAIAAVPASLLAGFLFQNLVVSIVSPLIASPAEFDTIRAYNFVATFTMWAVLSAAYWPAASQSGPAHRRLMIGTSAVLALIILYFLVGLVSSPSGAAIYLRNIATPFLVFQACLVASIRRPDGLAGTLPALGWAALLFGYAELFARAQLFDLINGDTFLRFSMRQQIASGEWLREMQETGRVVRGMEDMLKVDLFNTSLLADLRIRIYRLQGPNFHSISFAYALAVFGLFRLGAGRPVYLLAALPILLIIGSKGALVLALLGGTAVLGFMWTGARSVMTLFLLLLVAYSAAAIAIGIWSGDYHAMGLLGGVSGFLKNPFGRGLGAGGNLSMDMTRIDWSRSQALGMTDLAVESAFGVLLFQMGVAGLAVWAAPSIVSWTAWKTAVRDRRADLATAAFAPVVIAVNGLLQEEALFGPLALAHCMLFVALALGRSPPGARPEALHGRDARPRLQRSLALSRAPR